jgi:hypothetical protein
MGLTYDDLNTGDPTTSKIATALDNYYSTSAFGPISSAISDTWRGINHRQTPNAVPMNRDYHGFTFFTRPRCNMTSQNLQQFRLMAPLLNTDDLTIPRAIRALLDTDAKLVGDGKQSHSSRLVDDYQVFIPILTNQLVSMGGWPDILAPTYTSKPGGYQESFSMVDGIVEHYGTFDLHCNFRNLAGDPIMALFLYWVYYQSLVQRGALVPYPDMIIDNEIDYMTRIYRLVMDPSRRFVQKIAACGAAFPLDVPIGNSFNFEADNGPINRANDQITVTFRAIGAMYQDDILIREFNQAVVLQNNQMDDSGDENNPDATREQYYVQLDALYAPLFNNMGYPRINPDTYELQWWIDKDIYNNTVGQYQASQQP